MNIKYTPAPTITQNNTTTYTGIPGYTTSTSNTFSNNIGGWLTTSGTNYTYSNHVYQLKDFLETYYWDINTLAEYEEVQKKLKEKLKILLTNETKVGKIMYANKP